MVQRHCGALGRHRPARVHRPDAHRRPAAPGGRTCPVHLALQRPPTTSLTGTTATQPANANRWPERRPRSTPTPPGWADQRVLAGSVAEPTLRAPQGNRSTFPCRARCKTRRRSSASRQWRSVTTGVNSPGRSSTATGGSNTRSRCAGPAHNRPRPDQPRTDVTLTGDNRCAASVGARR